MNKTQELRRALKALLKSYLVACSIEGTSSRYDPVVIRAEAALEALKAHP